MANDMISNLGRIMAVWAHPDDESWYMGGLMATACANGQAVCCITATKGEGGTTDPVRWPPAKMAVLREHEMAEALSTLGVKEHHWLGLVDGTCAQADESKIVSRLVDMINEFQPDSVFTFGPAGSSGHPDHKAVSRWTTEALKHASFKKRPELYYAVESKEWYEQIGKKLDRDFNFFHDIDMPPLVAKADMDLGFELDETTLAKKLAALGCHSSQMTAILASFPPTERKAALGYEGFIEASNSLHVAHD